MRKWFALMVILILVMIPGVAMAAYTDNVIPTMTSNTASSGIASASGIWSDDYKPWKAFNGTNNPGEYWAASFRSVGWLQYDFQTEKVITAYAVTNQNGGYYVEQSPKDWTFEGSNDGVIWTILDTRNNQTGWANSERRFYTFNNNNGYSKYRINVTTIVTAPNQSSNFTLTIGELEMMENAVTSPTSLTTTPGDSQISLSWGAVSVAASYNIKRSTASGGPYETVASSVYNTYTDTTVTNGTTYYYVVTAVTVDGESTNSNEASATPQGTVQPPDEDGRAVLWVTMNNGSDIDYDLSMAEVNAFINWYKSKASGGVGDPFYTFSKTPLSPYSSRTDYLVFDKIVCFKVNQY
jgi:hypothetical protein